MGRGQKKRSQKYLPEKAETGLTQLDGEQVHVIELPNILLSRSRPAGLTADSVRVQLGLR